MAEDDPLRHEFELAWEGHHREHAAHDKAHEREPNLLRDQREADRAVNEANEKREMDRRQSRQQWTFGIAFSGVAVIINLLLRLWPEGS